MHAGRLEVDEVDTPTRARTGRAGARESKTITDNQKEPDATEAGEILFWKAFLVSSV